MIEMVLKKRMSVIEIMKSKLASTMEQDPDQLPVQDLVRNLALDHVQGLAQYPVLGLDPNLAPDQIPGIDQSQGVEVVHANVVLVAGQGPIQEGGEDPDLAVHITIGTKDQEVFHPCPQGNVMLGVGITQK